MKYIELNTFVKLKGSAETGGQAKNLIIKGKVVVNGKVELQNKKKLVSGDKIKIENKEFTVMKEECKKNYFLRRPNSVSNSG